MKTRTLRNAISIALLVAATGVSERATAQDASAKTDKQGGAPTTHAPAKTPATESANADTPAPTNLQTITVTGTRIRGGTTPSPVITIGSEQIQQEGFTDLGEVIRSVPQNFSGGQNPGVAASANVSGNNYNATGGSSLNLRGLGPDATLTLLNGRRLSYGGAGQAVDISAIPIEAVDRLEIVPDGASAVYGSDAVGGVANVILRRDFEGVAVGARYGNAADGGLTTREYTATAGTTWNSGGLIVAGKKSSNDPIYSDQRDYTRSMYRPSTLWQRNDLRSGLLSLHQWMGQSAELHLDVLSSKRTSMTDAAYAGIYYHNTPTTKATLISPSVEWQLPNDWLITLGAAYGRDKTLTHQQVIRTATGARASDSLGTYSNSSHTYELGVEGGLFSLPGGEVRLAAGAGYRYTGFVSLGLSSNTTIADGSESSRFGYAELSAPLVSPGQVISGVHRLDLTGAIRTEDYRSYGRVTTPKFGLIYSPNDDVTLKTSWGKSFKAPRLLQRLSAQYVLYYPQTTLGGSTSPADATVLYRTGGRDSLQPERARTWSAAIALHPEAMPELEAELGWFAIDFGDRIVQPVAPTQALSNPIYAEFVNAQPTPADLAQALDASDYFYNYAGAPYDADKVAAIVDGRYINASRQKVKGVDLTGSYRFDLGAGCLVIRGSATWLHSTQATIPTQRPYQLAGTLYYPAKTTGRLGATWTRGGFTVSAFGNYKSGVTNTTDGKQGASFTTFDGTLSYHTRETARPFSGMTFEVSVQNLLDRAPPLYAVSAFNETPYDSTNYSAVGRLVSISVAKRW